ncbi:hypothetical protein CJF30_00005231 [Rutstroemia sp. NJR-2017a BBW]|nr:hypothetical protein CJF30_00005231 [Rutstroemia sp. NJR-2017a BBW]
MLSRTKKNLHPKLHSLLTSLVKSKSSTATSALKSQSRIKAGKSMKHPFTETNGDIAMFKRVILQNYDEQISEPVEDIRRKTGLVRKEPRRTRIVKSRKKSLHQNSFKTGPNGAVQPVANGQPIPTVSNTGVSSAQPDPISFTINENQPNPTGGMDFFTDLDFDSFLNDKQW